MVHWVEREARRANRNLLITNMVFLIGTILVLALSWDHGRLLESGIIVIIIGIGILLLCGWNVVKASRRYSEIQTSPVWKHAAVYGNVDQVATQIEQDQQMGKTKYGKLQVMPSWLVRRNFFSTWMSPLNDLAWVYKKVTRHYTNAIPTGKTYAAVIVGRHRQRIEVQMSQKKTEQLMADLAQRAPWAIYGYSKEIADTWQRDPNGFVAAVDSRRQQLAAKG